jgi:hypothetical protein
MSKTPSEIAFENAVEAATQARAYGVGDERAEEARRAYQSALISEGRNEFEIIRALQELDDLCEDVSGEWLEECRQGRLPTPRDDESQDEANVRVCRILHLLNEPLPGTGTPLGDWVNASGWIHPIRSSDTDLT